MGSTWEEKFKTNLLEVLYRPDQPRVPAGVPEGGQFASDGGGSGFLSDEGETRVRAVEDGIVGSPVEIGVAFDKDGNELFRVQGTEDSVSFSPDQVRMMVGQVLTHNHPTGSSFSPSDVLVAQQAGLKEIRAVGKDYVYKISGPGGRWKQEYTSQSTGTTASLATHIENIAGRVYDELVATVYAGAMSASEANSVHHHTLWTRVSEDIGLQYGRTARN